MEETKDIGGMLNLMVRPAFFVKDGMICRVNEAARRRMIAEGTAISQLLMTGVDEYARFQDGCLYLTLNISGIPASASVTRMDSCDIFVVEQDEDLSDLQAMALAAQELRQPLNNVMTVADRLFPIAGVDDDPALLDQVARINRGLFQMLRIISNMSDAYRYCQDLVPRQETREICSMVEELFAANADLIRHTGIELKFNVPKESIYCLVDAEKLERAINNILSNAVKFTPKGGTVEARLTRRGNMLQLCVQDSGPGIDSSLRSSLYSRYQRQPGIEDGRYGIGLGMVLIRSAAAAHGGTVLIQQPEGRGMRLTMTMVIRQNTDNTIRSSIFHVDYAGERDHRLVELSEILPADLYRRENIN